MIYILDAGFGNIHSVVRAFKYIGKNVVVTPDLKKVTSKDVIVLPGVGSFASAIEKMHSNNVFDRLLDLRQEKIPFFGICIGLQLLCDSSEERPGIKGLGLIPGVVKGFKPDNNYPVPQIGWNSIQVNKNELQEFSDKYFYFVHSYYVDPVDKSTVLAETEYGVKFTSMVVQEKLIATQFHPEKSGKTGLRLIKNIMEYLEK